MKRTDGIWICIFLSTHYHTINQDSVAQQNIINNTKNTKKNITLKSFSSFVIACSVAHRAWSEQVPAETVAARNKRSDGGMWGGQQLWRWPPQPPSPSAAATAARVIVGDQQWVDVWRRREMRWRCFFARNTRRRRWRGQSDRVSVQTDASSTLRQCSDCSVFGWS